MFGFQIAVEFRKPEWMDDIAARPSFAATVTPPEMKPKLAN